MYFVFLPQAIFFVILKEACENLSAKVNKITF